MSKHRLDRRAVPRHLAQRQGRLRSTRPASRHTGRSWGLALLLTTAVVAVPVMSLANLDLAAPGRGTTLREAPPSAPTGPTADSPAGEMPTLEPSATAVAAPAETRKEKSLPAAPSREPILEAGPGTFALAAAAPAETRGATTYRVEVEHGLPFAPADVAGFVESTLSDPRGWAAGEQHRLVRVGHSADLRIVLASPETADKLCAPLDTQGRLSCRNGADVVINAWRWRHGADGYAGRLIDYRRYVVNHETGHALGYPHASCPGAKQPAPVMVQQTLGLDGCKPNPWPAAVDLR